MAVAVNVIYKGNDEFEVVAEEYVITVIENHFNGEVQVYRGGELEFTQE